MATQTLEQLVVQILMNNQQVLNGIGQVITAFDKLKKAAGIAAFASAAVFAVRKVNEFVDQANAIGNLSKSLNANAEDVQAWGEAVKRQGGTAEEFQGTIKSLSRELTMIPIQGGSSPLVQHLTRLGISFYGLGGKIKQPIQLLKELSGQFQRFSSSESMAIGQKIGLDEGTIRLLQKGRKGLDELIERIKKIGLYTQKDIETSQKLKQVYYDWQQASTALAIRLTRYFLPIAEKMAKWFQSFLSWSSRNERKITAFFGALAAVITVSLVPAIKSATVALMGFLMNPFVLAIAALGTALYLLYEDYLAWAEGAPSAFDWGPFVEGVKYVKDILSGFFDFMKVGVEGLVDILKTLSGWLNKVIDRLERTEFGKHLVNQFRIFGRVNKWFWTETAKDVEKLAGKILDAEDYVITGQLGDDIYTIQHGKKDFTKLAIDPKKVAAMTAPIPAAHLPNRGNKTPDVNQTYYFNNVKIDGNTEEGRVLQNIVKSAKENSSYEDLINMTYQGNYGMEGGIM